MATEWQLDNVSVVQAARSVETASKSGGVEFRRRWDDANIVEFTVMADKSTYCGYLIIADTAVGRRQRLKITVGDDASKPPPKAGGLGGMFAKTATFAARPDVIEKATEVLKGVLPPI